MAMALALIDSHALRRETITSLGLSPDASDRDLVAAALRRAAGTLCPCPPRTLAEAVASSLRGMVAVDLLKQSSNEVLDRLLAIGDLLEMIAEDEPGGPRRRMIYAAPPAFCESAPGTL